ncbi:MAG TPA: energy transducer TonB [Ignavibacteriaceae bacterium]|nr:energy transducer TonB [Ignavibacteriaceae bacterium]
MNYKSIKSLSISISLLFHLILLLLFLVLKFSIDYPVKDYVELSFGVSGEPGSSGNIGSQINEVEELSKPEEKNETVDKSKEVKEVELPEAKNTSDENIIKPADKEKDKSVSSKSESNEKADDKITTEGQGNLAEGEGSFGYDINWGGQGKRSIRNYKIPAYPEGVQKEIDIRLKFSIMPDGTVGTIIPLTKADTKLENAAINSLRQWRFEPLSQNQKQAEQTAVIVFPYRLQ